MPQVDMTTTHAVVRIGDGTAAIGVADGLLGGFASRVVFAPRVGSCTTEPGLANSPRSDRPYTTIIVAPFHQCPHPQPASRFSSVNPTLATWDGVARTALPVGTA